MRTNPLSTQSTLESIRHIDETQDRALGARAPHEWALPKAQPIFRCDALSRAVAEVRAILPVIYPMRYPAFNMVGRFGEALTSANTFHITADSLRLPMSSALFKVAHRRSQSFRATASCCGGCRPQMRTLQVSASIPLLVPLPLSVGDWQLSH